MQTSHPYIIYTSNKDLGAFCIDTGKGITRCRCFIVHGVESVDSCLMHEHPGNVSGDCDFAPYSNNSCDVRRDAVNHQTVPRSVYSSLWLFALLDFMFISQTIRNCYQENSSGQTE
jgi:hypothetical protein